VVVPPATAQVPNQWPFTPSVNDMGENVVKTGSCAQIPGIYLMVKENQMQCKNKNVNDNGLFKKLSHSLGLL